MLSVIMLGVIMLGIIMLIVILLSVVEPIREVHKSSTPWDRIHNTSLTNGPNKLECYTTLGQKCLPGMDTLAYSAYL